MTRVAQRGSVLTLAALLGGPFRAFSSTFPTPLKVVPLTDFGFAAEVQGLDAGQSQTDETMRRVLHAFEQHSVLVLRRVGLDDQGLVAFARRFASLVPGSYLEESRGPAQIGRRSDEQQDDSIIGKVANYDLTSGEFLGHSSQVLRHRCGNGYWHIDSSYKAAPALASLLDGRVVPPPGGGGATEFASARAAFADLSAGLQQELQDLIAVHDFVYSVSLDGSSVASSWGRKLPPARHLFVRKTAGGHSLYVGKHCSHIEAKSLSDGRELIRSLNTHIASARYMYRHEWCPGDLVLCDNRSCMHRGTPWRDAGRVRRMLCLVKVSEGENDVDAAGLPGGSVGRSAPVAPAEALSMLAACGLGDLPAEEGSGVMYSQRRGLRD